MLCSTGYCDLPSTACVVVRVGRHRAPTRTCKSITQTFKPRHAPTSGAQHKSVTCHPFGLQMTAVLARARCVALSQGIINAD